MKAFFLGLICVCNITKAASLPPLPSALNAMNSDERVVVESLKEPSWRSKRSYFSFQPTAVSSEIGVIFYPGGRVDPIGYAPLVRKLAEKGYRSFLIPMPFDIANFGQLRAEQIIRNHTEIKKWVIGGHSLGGVSASYFTKKSSDKLAGLFLWASYPSRFNDISHLDLEVVSIFAELDGLTKLSQIEKNKKYLPPNTLYHMIAGGNHTWFGSYGDGEPQRGDNEAGITRRDQQQQVLELTIQWLQKI